VRTGQLAAWCRLDRQKLLRALARLGVASPGGYVDLVEIAERAVEGADRRRGSDSDDPGALQLAKLREEVANLEAKRAWVRTRIKTLRREWVRVEELQEKLGRVSATLARAGEQLGRRFGAEAQELFNSTLDAAIDSIASGTKARKKKPKAEGKRKK